MRDLVKSEMKQVQGGDLRVLSPYSEWSGSGGGSGGIYIPADAGHPSYGNFKAYVSSLGLTIGGNGGIVCC